MNKKTLADLLKFFLIGFSMVMGFFFIYAFVLFAFNLPLTHLASAILIIISIASVYGLYRWVRED